MSPAEYVIDRFGGPSALAYVLTAVREERVDRRTVWKWQRSGYIPPAWHRPILVAAQREGVDITPWHIVYGSEEEI